MGKSDTAIKNYTKRNDIFADLFNVYLYNGRQVIRPESLMDEDTTEIAVPFQKSQKEYTQKYRDVLKTAVLKQDGKCRYLLLGLEAQKNVHYAMPVRTGLYDMMRYSQQVSKIASGNRKRWKEAAKETDEKEQAEKWNSTDEFLSGFGKEDKIKPVITLVLFLSPEPWDGPKTLHDLMEIPSEDLKKFIPDYPLQLIEPYTMTETQLSEFHTSMKQVLNYIKVSKEKEKTKQLVFRDAAFTHLERDAAWVIETSTNTKLRMQEKEGACVDMCQALIDWEAEARADEREKVKKDMCQAMIDWEAEARADEREKVTNEVTEKVTNEVTEKVTNDMTHVVISNMYREHFSIEQISRVMNKSEEEVKKILKR